MGMFDDFGFVPGILPQKYNEVNWQTKSLDRNMDYYVVDLEKKLYKREIDWETFKVQLLPVTIGVNYIPIYYTGEIEVHGFENFYDWGFENITDKKFYCLILIFDVGKLISWREEE